MIVRINGTLALANSDYDRLHKDIVEGTLPVDDALINAFQSIEWNHWGEISAGFNKEVEHISNLPNFWTHEAMYAFFNHVGEILNLICGFFI